MGKIKGFDKRKLFMGLIYNSHKPLDSALDILKTEFGAIDFFSDEFIFDLTDYYNKEMGSQLKRKFISFERLINPQLLSAVKIRSNKIEEELSTPGSASRNINVDPGIMSPANIILASTKDFSHRLPLSEGIYGEITLIYKGNNFRECPWTYPDYKLPASIDFFKKIRAQLMIDLTKEI